MDSDFRIVILGAGFSRPAGFPVASELWQQISEIAANLRGRASKFNIDLENYINYMCASENEEFSICDVNFENFIQYLDIEHFLGLRGSDTWSDEGNEGTVVTKTLIGKILARCLSNLDDIPELYIEFARRLRPNDFVITFNYDTLLEAALDAVNKPYRLFPTRYKSVHEFGGVVGDDRDEVIILKVHGSIDWFDRASFERREKEMSQLGAPPPDDIVFSYSDELDLSPLVDGPRFSDDPMQSLYRVRNLAALYEKEIMFLATPRMLPPSTAKIIYAARLGDFWHGLNVGGSLNFGMAIVGFSLPPQDEYARQIIYKLVGNYQRLHWGKEILGKKKTPLTLVDYFESDEDEEAFRKRYQFVDWKRATLHGEGFDRKALDIIFPWYRVSGARNDVSCGEP